MFLIVMVVGLAGLVVMALPAIGHHGHGVGHHHGHGLHDLHATHALHVPHAPHGSHASHPSHASHAQHAAHDYTRFIPSPRLVFSLLALWGAFGNAFARAAHLAPLWAGLAAVLPTILVDRFAVTPLWRLLFRFQGAPSSPLEELILSEATAVTAFRNGRGIVSLVRDGRSVQLAARLVDRQAGRAVRVGERLRVEDVDARNERLTVVAPDE